MAQMELFTTRYLMNYNYHVKCCRDLATPVETEPSIQAAVKLHPAADSHNEYLIIDFIKSEIYFQGEDATGSIRSGIIMLRGLSSTGEIYGHV